MRSNRRVVVSGESDGEPVHSELFYICHQYLTGDIRKHLVRADSTEEAVEYVEQKRHGGIIRCDGIIGIPDSVDGVMFTC